ncbi:hypothetical protein [Calidithermus chliarophilus]|uniref:hypothetical protein n=1 Tax=Calidithermus chliarophilus TaxID=52023 RepID=UPI000410E998|nr:hypothetical protein [Calidithermus chliarophilus]
MVGKSTQAAGLASDYLAAHAEVLEQLPERFQLVGIDLDYPRGLAAALQQPLDPAEGPAVYALVRGERLVALLTPGGGLGVEEAA